MATSTTPPEWPFPYLAVVVLALATLAILSTFRRVNSRFDFMKNGMSTLKKEVERHPSQPFRMPTDLGEVTVIPPDNAAYLRNLTDLDFREAITKYVRLIRPPASSEENLQETKDMCLDTIIEPLSSEASFTTELIFGSRPGWKEIPAKDALLELVARLSSRVFLGSDICRNEKWLRITKEFTTTSFAAAAKLNMLPWVLRPLANLLDPSCQQVRAFIAEAEGILLPVIESRCKVKEAAKKAGKPVPVFNDTIEWAEAESQGTQYDPVAFQLMISFVAIHTTYDLLGRVLLLLAEHQETIKPLRQEMIEVLQAEGWSKTALNHMKLLDSTIKESQRISPTSLLTLRRIAVNDVTLPDGTRVRRGERLYTHCCNMMEPEVYPNPDRFDISRFKRLREQAGGESKAQLITLTPEHLGFGYGVYSCPGRFFAGHEIKIALCHLLLKYDWKLADESGFNPTIIGVNSFIDPSMLIMFKRRKEEIDLDALRYDEGVAFENEGTSSG
ncbi:Cytochrome P450 monooygenase 1 [Colletotrichum gloeosporioides]|uniref:Cytochrome P450 monooygenase 1 n=1 Tax=Colletotrichum gloeosporioides TaxID=474922 RepID=A0A8H4CUD6_COLGL|nr:Cytochrome P450 monooygenase 1 [Colletotrichum gloeosporioides]KAF3810343.1 Cytochrome P450 monooygenase 1 [Colletotrichum gloeosporioides]